MQAAINAAGTFLPADLPQPPDLQQGQPGRHADRDAGAHLAHAAAAGDPVSRRHAARDQDLAAARRRTRQHQRRTAPGRAHPGQSEGARRLQPLARRPAHRDRQRQLEPGEGQLRRARRARRPSTPTTSCKSADEFKSHDRRLPQRRAGAAGRRGRRRRRRREHAPRRVGQRVGGGHRQHPAPARRQRDRGGRPHQAPAAAALGVAARRGRRRDADRPHRDHPRVGARRAVRAAARRRARGDDHLPVPAQRGGHGHPERGGAAVARRHVRA